MTNEGLLREWIEFLEEQLGHELDEAEIAELASRLDKEEGR